MDTITPNTIDELASLAKLRLSAEESRRLQKDLSGILAYVEKLNALDLENVAETAHVLDLTNVFREDAVKPGLTQEQALANAPLQKNGYFSVPKVIEQAT